MDRREFVAATGAALVTATGTRLPSLRRSVAVQEPTFSPAVFTARIEKARAQGAAVVDSRDTDVADALIEMTDGRGPDAVIDAVGMEAHGNPWSEKVIGAASRLPKPVARGAVERFGIDRLAALHTAVAAVRRGAL